jgi:F-type H+-transporting ATPase subunit beta
MSNGIVTQIIGAVIDVEFDKDNIPKVYEALMVDESGTTLEVQQQLGDGVVRTIAMGATEGLKRGFSSIKNQCPYLSSSWPETLGRIVDVLGNPIDEKGLLVKKIRCQFTENHHHILISQHQMRFLRLALKLLI